MRVTSFEAIPLSVPYLHTERSSQISRDGVTEVVVRLQTDDGLTGWGESCSGADTASVHAALEAMAPYVIGRDPWDAEAIRNELFFHGLWQYRAGTGNFAFAGIDMALWDLRGKAAGVPLYRLLGGRCQESVNYFCYLSRGTDEGLVEQCSRGVRDGYTVFYLKVGLDDEDDERMVRTVRETVGAQALLRLDANGAWTTAQAKRMLERLAPLGIDFVEQPVRETPIVQLKELRKVSPIPICANEGLWSEADAYARIVARQADVFCFSPFWVGSVSAFHRLAHVAHLEGLLVCKHTHGELGIAAAAAQHVLLTLPNIVQGNQQTTNLLLEDITTQALPIASGPEWGAIEGPGLGVEIDPDAFARARERYMRDGQFKPWRPATEPWREQPGDKEGLR